MFKLINRLKNKKGFTLIELIVVLAVLGIIALIAIPRFLQVQAQAKIDADYGTAAGIAKAAELYFVQNSTTPDIATLISSSYLDAWDQDWQSDKFGTSVVISIDASTGEVKVTDGSNTLYPIPATPMTP